MRFSQEIYNWVTGVYSVYSRIIGQNDPRFFPRVFISINRSTAPFQWMTVVSPWLDRWKRLLPGVHRWYCKTSLEWDLVFESWRFCWIFQGEALKRNAECWVDASGFWMSSLRTGRLASSYCFINWKINSMIWVNYNELTTSEPWKS